MDYELSRVNSIVQEFDKDLIARRNKDGVIQVCQLIRQWDAMDIDGKTVMYPRDIPSLVFSLTDTWTVNGKAAEWGHEPLYWKLKEISFERRDEMLRDIEQTNQKAQESKQRDLKNHFEAAAYEACDVFKKTFNDINTSSMDKSKDPRRRQDRSKKWQ